MEEKWNDLLKELDGIIEESQQGKPMYRYKRVAAYEIRKLANHVDAKDVIDVVLAMYLMQKFDPHRFRSDKAFWFQLVRRVRGLTKANAGVWKHPETGKPKVAYKDLPPKGTLAVAHYIRGALGSAGVFIARHELEERQRVEQDRLSYFQSLKELV